MPELPAPLIDFGQATRHAQALHGPGLVPVQAFDDDAERSDRSLARFDYFDFSDEVERRRLEKLAERGAGIFLAVNPTDGLGRRQENVIGINAVWADIDDGRDVETIPWPIAPSVLVRTPGGGHAYWLVDDDVGPDAFERHAALLENICHLTGADRGAKGVNRVLRLAGSLHQKSKPAVRVELLKCPSPRVGGR